VKMHKNSLNAFREGINKTFKTRSQNIFEAFYFGSKKLTDRGVLKALFPFSDNKGLVSPRLTDMLKQGILEEVGEKLEGNKTVRVLAIKTPVEERKQTELF